MKLNKSKGNMYKWVTHTWNPIKGHCYHNCSYCYMHTMQKRFKHLDHPPQLDDKELKTNLGSERTIFVGSSTDILAPNIPHEWIARVLLTAIEYNNTYLIQSKNPKRAIELYKDGLLPKRTIIATTLESNFFLEPMGNSPEPMQRSIAMQRLSMVVDTYVTIEPIIDFHLYDFVKMIRICMPNQVNIGADTGQNDLPEPSPEKIRKLIHELEKFTRVVQKKNLKRLL